MEAIDVRLVRSQAGRHVLMRLEWDQRKDKLAALRTEIERLNDLVWSMRHEAPCDHAWHCERCGMDGTGMAGLRAEWESHDLPA